METQKVQIVHLQMVRDSMVPYGGEKLGCAYEAVELAKQLIPQADREYVIICCVDSAMKPTSIEIAGTGGVNSCPIYCANLFKSAILSNAMGILMFHNHPSGDVTPSRDDYECTERVQKAGEILGIPLIDHIILGDGDYYSFKEQNKLQETRNR